MPGFYWNPTLVIFGPKIQLLPTVITQKEAYYRGVLNVLNKSKLRLYSTVVFKDVKKVVFYVFINKKKLLSNMKRAYLGHFFDQNDNFLSCLAQINVSSTSRRNPLEFESVLIWKINVDKVAVFEKSQFSWNQSGFKIRFSQFLWNQSGFKLTFDRFRWYFFFVTWFQVPKTAVFWPKITICWVSYYTKNLNRE